MLIQRTVQVFKLRSVAGLAILAAVLLGSMGLTRLDPLGISTWVPEAEQVSKIELCYDVYAYYYNEPVALTEDEIPAGLEVHRQLLEEHTDDKSSIGSTDIEVVYTLTSGRMVYRKYRIPVSSPVGDTLNSWFSAPEHVLKYEDWENCLNSLVEIRVENAVYTGEEARDLLTAVKADCEAGTMTQDWDFQDRNSTGAVGSYSWLSITFDDTLASSHYYRELTIYDDSLNTVAWLRERESEWRHDYE